MTEHAPDRIWTGIDIPKTIAGVLATVSAAVLGSFLGVAGTLVGAALASVIGTIGTEVYQRSIHKGAQKLQQSFVTAPAAVGTPSVVAADHDLPSEPEVPDPPRQIRWKRVGAIAAAVFILALGTLTVFELITGRSAADAVGNKSGSSTTIGSVLSGNSSSDDKSGTTTPSTSPSTSPTDGATTTPTGTPTTDPTTAPTEAPTTAPTTDPGTTTEPAAPETATATTQAPAGADNQNPQPQGTE
jgi:cytoskeletal protein RodZ